MTIRHMKIFKTVCESNCNMTKAAERLGMTQPAVSLAISELENYYGVRLFDRISRRLYLSEAGRMFLEYSDSISLKFDDMENRIRSWESKGIIKIGASISIGSMLLPGFVKNYNKVYPDVTVKVKIDRSDELLNKLPENKLDLALIEGIVHDQNLYCEDFMEDRLALVASCDYPADVIDAKDIYSVNFLLREKGSGTREVFESTLTANSCPLPEPSWESLSTAALVNASEMGLGVAVVPYRMVSGRIKAGDVKEVSIGGISFIRKYKIVYHKDKELSSAALNFLEICRNSGKPAENFIN